MWPNIRCVNHSCNRCPYQICNLHSNICVHSGSYFLCIRTPMNVSSHVFHAFQIHSSNFRSYINLCLSAHISSDFRLTDERIWQCNENYVQINVVACCLFCWIFSGAVNIFKCQTGALNNRIGRNAKMENDFPKCHVNFTPIHIHPRGYDKWMS